MKTIRADSHFTIERDAAIVRINNVRSGMIGRKEGELIYVALNGTPFHDPKKGLGYCLPVPLVPYLKQCKVTGVLFQYPSLEVQYLYHFKGDKLPVIKYTGRPYVFISLSKFSIVPITTVYRAPRKKRKSKRHVFTAGEDQ